MLISWASDNFNSWRGLRHETGSSLASEQRPPTRNYYDQRTTSPRTVADVRADVLREAILEGWNVRYGAQLTDFEQILVP